MAQDEPMLDAGVHRELPPNLDPRLKEVSEVLDKAREPAPVTDEEWAKVCAAVGLHPSVKSYTHSIRPYPFQVFVRLLNHPQLNVRLGALELMESKAGDTPVGFDPWHPGGAQNSRVLEEWTAWAVAKTEAPARDVGTPPPPQKGLLGFAQRLFGSNGSGGQSGKAPPPQRVPLDEGKFRAYLVDLVSEDKERQERAVSMLGDFGLEAVAALEKYTVDTPQLSDGVKARLRETQYRIVIQASLPNEASRLAHDLVYGTRNTRLDAMQMLPRCGLKAIPILARDLEDPDALIREAAADIIIKAGGERIYPLLEKHVAAEPDVNVIHAVLRGLDAKNAKAAEILVRYCRSDNEDLAVTALHQLADKSSVAAVKEIPACLQDSRWRVRVAAMEYAAKVKNASAKPSILKALDDEDEFVRYAAVKAAADMGMKEAQDRLISLAEKDDSMLGTVMAALVKLSNPTPNYSDNATKEVPPPAAFLKSLSKRSGEALLAVVRTMDGERRGGALGPWKKELLHELAKHPDPDVRSASVRVLAWDLKDPANRAVVEKTLADSDDDIRESILESTPRGSFDFRDPAVALESGADANQQDASSLPAAQKPTPNPEQEAVYSAFQANAGSAPTAIVSDEDEAGDEDKLALNEASLAGDAGLKQKFEKWARDGSPGLRFQSALQLLGGGSQSATKEMLAGFSKRPVHERVVVAHTLAQSTKRLPDALVREFAKALLTDPSPDVRESVIELITEAPDSALREMLYAEMSLAESALKPSEISGYRMSSLAESVAGKRRMLKWCEDVLVDPNSSIPVKVQALSALPFSGGKSRIVELALPLTKSPDQWIRRQAWRVAGQADRNVFEDGLDAMAVDPSSKVRENIPRYYMTGRDTEWEVYYTELESDSEYRPYDRRDNVARQMPERAEAALRALCQDSSPEVRMGAMLALLANRKSVGSWELGAALESMPDAEARESLVQSFLSEHGTKLGPAQGIMLNYVKSGNFTSDEWKRLSARMQAGGAADDESFTTFTSLVKLESAEAESAKNAETSAPVVDSAAAQEEALVVFFYKAGCKECEDVRSMLATLAKSLPQLKVHEENIESTEGVQKNQVLSNRFGVEANQRQVTPALFTQAGFLIKDNIRMGALQSMVDKVLELPKDEQWHQVDAQESAAAGEEIAKRYQSFSIWLVIVAGLADGVNPCAFATIIFFLSYLQIARRTPREILMVGLAFISAVFLAYFLVGFGLAQVISEIQGYEHARRVLNWVLAALALLIAILSIKDGILAMKGRAGDSTLQLPGFLKSRIRSTIREGTKATRFVIAAFVSGIIISLLELACTGQVYLPTITYMMQQGRLSATGWLLVYNLAFITPLVIIFILAFFGMKSDALIRFQTRHTAAVRFATAALFIALVIFLVRS